MYDLKPDAPVEYRGEFSPNPTNMPGIEVCELMPEHAKMADKFSVIRGIRTHGNHALASGQIGAVLQRSIGRALMIQMAETTG